MREGKRMHEASMSGQRIACMGISEWTTASCGHLPKRDEIRKRGGTTVTCRELADISRDEGGGGDASSCHELPGNGMT
jgi:hypothetical protein